MTTAPYDAIADWYDSLVDSGPLYQDVILPQLLDLVGQVSDASVCDLACGTGLVSRALAERGAQVTGVDIAAKMLDLARRREESQPLGIQYVQDDAQELTLLPNATYDGVTCSMALMNFTDFPKVLAALRKKLKQGGWFVFSIVHPCFQAPFSEWVEKEDGSVVRQVSRYFEEISWSSPNPNSVRGRVGEKHRTLATYVNTLINSGFRLECMVEPGAEGRRAAEAPGNVGVPSVLLMRWRAA